MRITEAHDYDLTGELMDDPALFGAIQSERRVSPAPAGIAPDV